MRSPEEQARGRVLTPAPYLGTLTVPGTVLTDSDSGLDP